MLVVGDPSSSFSLRAGRCPSRPPPAPSAAVPRPKPSSTRSRLPRPRRGRRRPRLGAPVGRYRRRVRTPRTVRADRAGHPRHPRSGRLPPTRPRTGASPTPAGPSSTRRATTSSSKHLPHPVTPGRSCPESSSPRSSPGCTHRTPKHDSPIRSSGCSAPASKHTSGNTTTPATTPACWDTRPAPSHERCSRPPAAPRRRTSSNGSPWKPNGSGRFRYPRISASLSMSSTRTSSTFSSARSWASRIPSMAVPAWCGPPGGPAP